MKMFWKLNFSVHMDGAFLPLSYNWRGKFWPGLITVLQLPSSYCVPPKCIFFLSFPYHQAARNTPHRSIKRARSHASIPPTNKCLPLKAWQRGFATAPFCGALCKISRRCRAVLFVDTASNTVILKCIWRKVINGKYWRQHSVQCRSIKRPY